MRRFFAAAAALVGAGALLLLAQPSPVTVNEDFESLAVGVTPPGWVDDLVGSLTSRAHGFFQIAVDPTNPSNQVLASSGDAGMERGAAITRTGLVAHRYSPVFDVSAGTFIFTGRIWRSSSDGAVGVVFLSTYPARDSYYLLACWPSGGAGSDRFWLTGVDAALPGGPIDLGVNAVAGNWYRFRIQADVVSGGTRLRAKVWADGGTEPGNNNIDIVDAASTRLTGGRIGVWASRRGIKAADDLAATGAGVIVSNPTPTPSPTSPTPTPTPGPGSVVVQLTESGGPLSDGSYFNRDVRPGWTILGGTPPYTVAASLSGQAFAAGGVVSAEGSYRFAVQATDSKGAAGQSAASFTIDKTPPTFSNLRPESTTVLNSRSILFTGTVSADAVSVNVSGTTALLAGGFFSVPNFALSEGANTLALTAVDRAGNVGKLSYPLTVDTIPPVIAITSPADHFVTKDGSVNVTGSVSDASATSVTVNGITAVVTGSSFSASGVALTEGSNPITATARDAAGNTGHSQITVDRDTIPPTISILDASRPLTDGGLLNHHPSPVVAVADAHLSGYTATLNNAPFVSGTLLPSDGAFTIDVQATDRAGNTAHRTVHFSVDTVPPRITNVSPADGSLLTSSPQPVTGNCDDAVSVTVNGVSAAVSGGKFRIDSFSFPEGPVTLAITARDLAGNVGTASVAITVDSLPPIITIDSPAAGSYLKTATATVTGVATDANLLSVSVNGVAATLGSGGAFTAPGVPLPEGPVTLTATATDKAGHTGTATVGVTADRTPPKIVVTESGAPVPDGSVFGRHPRITFLATDASPVTSHATLNGQPFVSGTEIDNDGTYALEVDASDAAGNSAVKNVSFGVDATAPRITNLQPPDGTITRQTSVTVTGDCDDAMSVTVAGVNASVSGGHFV